MKKSFIKKAIIVTSFVCLTGLSASATFAASEQTTGNPEAPMHMHHEMNQMTSEMQRKMDGQMEAFHTSTLALRQEIQSREFELKSVLSKPEVDEKKGTKLQKEISALRADLEQKKLKHMIAMHKINPELKMNMGMMMGQGKHMGKMMGHGKHMGKMMGQGKHMGMMKGKCMMMNQGEGKEHVMMEGTVSDHKEAI